MGFLALLLLHSAIAEETVVFRDRVLEVAKSKTMAEVTLRRHPGTYLVDVKAEDSEKLILTLVRSRDSGRELRITARKDTLQVTKAVP